MAIAAGWAGNGTYGESVITMKKNRIWILLLVLLLVLCGCGIGPNAEPEESAELETTEVPVVETLPADGDPGDVTCKGSYTASSHGTAVVATMENAQLTNEALWAWYWAAVSQYQQSSAADAPDFSRPLDTQICTIDTSVNSWQQYFLRQALENWHTSRALAAQAAVETLVMEDAYRPNETTHARCMTGMPATKFLYGYQTVYAPNTMHQAYLDRIPQMLEELASQLGYDSAEAMAKAAFGCSAETLEEMVRQYNDAYMYLTFLNYDLEITPEAAQAYYQENQEAYRDDTGAYVDIRHILLIPEDAAPESLQLCQDEAEKLLREWQNKKRGTEAAFAEMAYRHSQDPGTAASGGGYYGISQGQLPGALDEWCFDQVRQTGDTVVLTTDQGVHILYFVGSTPAWQAAVCEDLTRQHYDGQMQSAKDRFPMEVDYSAITLAPAEGSVSYGDFLYPDIAHERYPEVPLYLQQDYPTTWYGSYKIHSHGCGITTFSMLTTYMTDEEWTPPEMCDLYGGYSHSNGTDGMLFINEPSKFGYFFRERSYDSNYVKEALQQGYIVVSIQHKGYWTGGGHYILLEKLTEDGMVQVRDSNIANYAKLPAHKEDKHTWGNSVYASDGYWIFEPKVTRCNACRRCGTPDAQTYELLQADYLCPKCVTALSRRTTYLY